MGLFQHFVCVSSINCFFLFLCLYIFRDLFKILLPLAISISFEYLLLVFGLGRYRK